MSNLNGISRWSTDAEAPRNRLDVYAALLSESLSPMHLAAPETNGFFAHISAADMGFLSVVRQQGSAHRCYQGPRDHARAGERSYHLVLNLASSWDIQHRDALHMEAGDAVLVDSALPWDIRSPQTYEYVHIKLSDGWLRQWVPSPAALVGRRIGGSAGWGTALTAFAAQLSPEFVVRSPLPQSLIVDQIGSLLAWCAHDLAPPAKAASVAARSLHRRIEDCIAQRCTEPRLTAAEVAASVGVSLRTLHRCLSQQRLSFGNLVISARAEVGVRMLASPLFRKVGVAEIARRAGFSDASHFARVVRHQTGRTPTQLRSAPGAPDATTACP